MAAPIPAVAVVSAASPVARNFAADILAVVADIVVAVAVVAPSHRIAVVDILVDTAVAVVAAAVAVADTHFVDSNHHERYVASNILHFVEFERYLQFLPGENEFPCKAHLEKAVLMVVLEQFVFPCRGSKLMIFIVAHEEITV